MIELRRYWLLIAFPIAIAFAFTTPPFQAPDEVGHYWYANAIARGRLLPALVNGKPGAFVPRGVRDIVACLWVPTAGRPDLKVGMSRIRSAAQVPLQAADRVRVTFPAFYTAVPYAATAFACWLGDVFDLRPLVSFYLGRLLNAAAMILLTRAAVQRIASGGGRIATVALLPMALYLAGSFSPDAITIGVACYVTALALTPEERRGYWVHLTVAATLLALCKPVYFLIPMIVVVTQHAWRSNAWRIATVAIAIAAGLTVSAWTARRNYFPMRQDTPTSTSAQLANVVAHPTRFIAVAAHDYRDRGREYANELVGRLGWLDIQLPDTLVWITLALFLCVGVITPALIMTRARIAGVAIVIASCFLISLSQYLMWTTVGANEIEGIQGRYLLPLAPLALAVIGKTRPSLRVQQWTELLFATAALTLNVIGINTIVHRYY